jgi:hypothetical protein
MTNYIFYGLVTSAVSFGYTMLLYSLGYHGEKIDQATLFSNLGLIITVVGLILSIREARKERLEESQAFTYGSVFKAGFMTSVFMSMGAAIFSYIYIAYINPDMTDALVNMQREKMIEQGNPEEMIVQAENMVHIMTQPHIQAVMAIFGTILIGILITLILGIFMRASRSEKAVVAE